MDRLLRRRVLAAIAVGLILRLAVAVWLPWPNYDIESYRIVGERVLAGQNIYATPDNRYPYLPGWAAVEAAFVLGHRTTGLPFPLVARLPQLVADAGLIGLLAYLADDDSASVWDLPPVRVAWAHALNPVAIFVSAAHGQIEPVVIGIALAAVALLDSRPRMSALLAGLATLLKPIGVFVVPVVVFGRKDWAKWVQSVTILTLVILPVTALYALRDPALFLSRVGGYEGVRYLGWIALIETGIQFGYSIGAMPLPFGLGYLAISIPPIFSTISGVVAIAFAGVVAIQTGFRAENTGERLVGVAVVYIGALVIIGAWSVQYLYWPVCFCWLAPFSRWRWAYLGVATVGTWGLTEYLFRPVTSGVAADVGILYVAAAWGVTVWGLWQGIRAIDSYKIDSLNE